MSFILLPPAELGPFDSDAESSSRRDGLWGDLAIGVVALLLALTLTWLFPSPAGEKCASFGRAGLHCVAAEKTEALGAARCDRVGRAGAICRRAQ